VLPGLSNWPDIYYKFISHIYYKFINHSALHSGLSPSCAHMHSLCAVCLCAVCLMRCGMERKSRRMLVTHTHTPQAVQSLCAVCLMQRCGAHACNAVVLMHAPVSFVHLGMERKSRRMFVTHTHTPHKHTHTHTHTHTPHKHTHLITCAWSASLGGLAPLN